MEYSPARTITSMSTIFFNAKEKRIEINKYRAMMPKKIDGSTKIKVSELTSRSTIATTALLTDNLPEASGRLGTVSRGSIGHSPHRTEIQSGTKTIRCCLDVQNPYFGDAL